MEIRSMPRWTVRLLPPLTAMRLRRSAAIAANRDKTIKSAPVASAPLGTLN
jgi:hypothetical protein